MKMNMRSGIVPIVMDTVFVQRMVAFARFPASASVTMRIYKTPGV